MENSIEEDIKNAEHFIKSIKTDKEYKEENGWHGYYNKEIVELAKILEHILSDYKRVLKENEELKERNEYYISKSVIQDKIEEIINNSTFGCVGCEWNDIEVVQLLENMLLDRRDK